MAMDLVDIKDQIIYRGFIDESLDPDIEYDYDEQTLVMLCPLGQFEGSTSDGRSMLEIIDIDDAKNMAMNKDEVLLDKDHASMRDIKSRDTTAYGWVSNLKAISNGTDMDGLYGTIKWTSEGIRLAKERIYRYLSPVFQLDEDNHAIKLVNVALTNRPNLKMPPIMNAKGDDDDIVVRVKPTGDEKTCDECSDLDGEIIYADEDGKGIHPNCRCTLVQLNSKSNTEDTEMKDDLEKKEDKEKVDEAVEVVEETEVVEDKPVEKTFTKDEVDKMIKEAVDKAIAEKESESEEVEEEDDKSKVKKEKEVISKEALNSQNDIPGNFAADGSHEWQNLHGAEFFKWVEEHKNYLKK